MGTIFIFLLCQEQNGSCRGLHTSARVGPREEPHVAAMVQPCGGTVARRQRGNVAAQLHLGPPAVRLLREGIHHPRVLGSKKKEPARERRLCRVHRQRAHARVGRVGHGLSGKDLARLPPAGNGRLHSIAVLQARLRVWGVPKCRDVRAGHHVRLLSVPGQRVGRLGGALPRVRQKKRGSASAVSLLGRGGEVCGHMPKYDPRMNAKHACQQVIFFYRIFGWSKKKMTCWHACCIHSGFLILWHTFSTNFTCLAGRSLALSTSSQSM